MSRSALSPDGDGLRLMHVHAHPDDESSKGAATTAKYVAEGVAVMVATCTGGERGSVLNPAMDRPEIWADMPRIREQEMRRARAILGVQQVSLGYVDSGLPEGEDPDPLPEGCFGLMDPEAAAAPLVRAIRSFRPQVVTTYDEHGGYPHPDHVQCHRVTMAALRQAADPQLFPEYGPAWTVDKLYYQLGFNRKRFAALDAEMRRRGLESPYSERLAAWENFDYEQRITTRVDCADYFEVRDDALRAHASQIDPNGQWFAIPLDIQKAVWPTEDYQLVYSLVPVCLPEDDLFTGLRSQSRRPQLADLLVS
ncbi:mycothiol S-conjugate amidase [Propionibacterium cyclohexanicum]|uniref:Mycothiol S-conjugate amidase n=1 Tax=Propionibacterium cyclohexanicum TaxID=64702 RepID=A0A1H9RIG4_9ACTN|nr:mycothiol conjugate amidase Mca [Propionibacterium cyclohexanicum]SER71709.1 mycothiol S-conjugate amidase [Propionibacterium cyclohexanicum]